MHLGIDFWKDFGGFLKEKSKHVGTKIRSGGGPGGGLKGSWRPDPKTDDGDRFFGTLLGPSWGASWGRLGAGVAVLGRLWSSWTFKKSMQKSINF